MKDLQQLVGHSLQEFTRYETAQRHVSDIAGFIRALRKILTCTSSSDNIRLVMVLACITNLTALQKEKEFVTLLRESGDLGAEIIANKDLERAVLGFWLCGRSCEDVHPVCAACGEDFGAEWAWNRRLDEEWWCRYCEEKDVPTCLGCAKPVQWVQRGVR
jgi:hypothetical protein